MKLLVINPGSTSTKVSIYEDDLLLADGSIFHDAPELLKYPHVNDQIPFRRKVVTDFVADSGYQLADMDCFIGRGGSACSVPGGVIEINEQLYNDTLNAVGGSEHPAKLGTIIAWQLGQQYDKRSFTLNPTNVDELIDKARITGIRGVYHNAQSHVLNQKAVAVHHCEANGLDYRNCNLIVCHIDGGITVNAHCSGRMIDGNVGSGGSGAFTPTRIGDVPVLALLDYLETHSLQEVRNMCSRSGGFVSYFGTSNARAVYDLVVKKDAKAELIWNAMVYQIIKQIGAMAAALKGNVQAILLTGGLVDIEDIPDQIRESCSWIAPIYVYPGEMEQETLAKEVLKVLQGKEKPIEYTGKPVFSGFDFI